MLLIVHRGMDRVGSESSRIDLMLTPQFYTMKREALPVKYMYQAKRIAPSLFDGLVEEGQNQHYFVYKEEDSWVFIAYDPEEIIAFLRSKQVPLEKVRKIFFAQQIVPQIKAPLLLDEQLALIEIDNTATIVPRVVIEEEISLDPQAIVRPSRGIRLDTGTVSVFSPTQIWALSGILVLFGAVWLMEGLRYGKSDQAVQEKLQTLYRENPALQNSYTRENVVEKYRTIDSNERQKRDLVNKIVESLFKGTVLKKLEMGKKGYKAVFDAKDTKIEKRLESTLRQNGFKKSPSSSGNTIVIEGTL